MKTGIFGGSFDPPHIGHLIFSVDAYNILGIKKIVWLVNHTPCHKTMPIAPFSERIRFCEIISENFKFISISDLEEKLEKPNYTYDSVNFIKKQLGESNDYFLMIGMDQARLINTWKKSSELKDSLGFIVMRRGVEEEKPDIPESRLSFIDRRLDVSSSEIRGLVKKHLETEHLLGNELNNYVKKSGLYN
ncbi:nicotinate (nicotinamide) nucleotide adenylyltransferase [candidate division WOR-3 bacterium]|nr:nicotinate (nicotinamide) nucleotide adenylyltransferase [candidate division WOR-3 bacterium]